MAESETCLMTRALAYLADGVATAKKEFDSESGKFLAPNGGWAVTKQDIISPLALLYVTPGTKWYGKNEILQLACRGGDALRSSQYDERLC